MKRIFTEQLAAELEKKLLSIYYLVGQDPLLLSENQDLIYRFANSAGFDEKFQLQIDQMTDWNALFERCETMGLFFSRQVIILQLPENISQPIQHKLQELIHLLHQDILLILQIPKLNRHIEQQNWFIIAEQYNPHSLIVNCQTPTFDQLPRWIYFRANAMKLTLEPESIQQLAYSYENNLLALKQILQLLSLLYGEKKIPYLKVKELVEQSSLFTPYQWIDALLEGKENRANRILQGLREGDTQPILLLRILQKEMMVLLELAKPKQLTQLTDKLPTENLRSDFDRLKIWQNRRPLFTQAIKRLTYKKLYLIFQTLAEIERRIKQEFSDDIWDKIADLSVSFSTD